MTDRRFFLAQRAHAESWAPELVLCSWRGQGGPPRKTFQDEAVRFQTKKTRAVRRRAPRGPNLDAHAALIPGGAWGPQGEGA